MATLLLRPQSILLNPSPSASPHNHPLSLPSSPRRYPTVLSSSASSSSVDEETHPQKQTRSASVPGNPRRIRFAPLPVPDPNSDSVFLEPEIIPQDSTPNSRCSQESFSSEAAPKPIFQLKYEDCQTPTPLQLTPMPSFSGQSISLPPSPTSAKKKSLFSKRLLKPLFTPWNKSSSSVLSDNDSFCQSSSRDSIQSARGRLNSKPDDDEFGSPLSRWESSSTVSSYVSDSGRSLSRRPKPSRSSLNPLSRIQSTPVAKKHPSAKPGMRMLNGRVYGRRRPFSESSTNPFANVQTQEPEFVEWGYGGMGSNKSNAHSGVGGRWKSVQGDGNTSAFGGGRSAAGDEDDASGMAWVKRRKEMRERQKIEKERQEAISKDATGGEPTVVHENTVSTTHKDQATGDEFKEEENTPKIYSGSIPSSPQSESFSTYPPQDGLEQMYTAVTLLPTAHKHHHHPSTHKRDLSAYRPSPIIQTPSSEDPKGLTLGALDTNVTSLVMGDGAVAEADRKTYELRDIRDREDSNGSTSEEEDSSVSDDDDDDEDTDSDSDSEDQEATRKTALGAGVEKISRHKDHQEPRNSAATSTVNVNSAPNTPGVGLVSIE